jgi:tetratricopeptide (TPR) repeat protein
MLSGSDSSKLIFLCLIFGAAFAGLIFLSLWKARERGPIVLKWLITLPVLLAIPFSVKLLGAFGPFLIVFCAIILSFLWAPHIGAALASPITSALDGGDTPPDLKPFYSIAQAREKQGRYAEAIAEIQKQLKTFPEDYEGQLLLAQIQAEHLGDLDAAEAAVQHLCAQKSHPPRVIAYALYAMADWHLALKQDSYSARLCLQQIIDRFPDTEFSQGAAQRIAHLKSGIIEAPKKFNVVEGIRNLGLRPKSEAHVPAPSQDPGEQANYYVQQLESHPQDTEAREKLAVLYAEHYGRLDMATLELEQLIGQPNHSQKKTIHWLNLLADLQIKGGADHDAIRATLERIEGRFPNSAAAEIARNRLDRLRLETNARKVNQPIKLGTYEQNIGLKRGSAGRD